MTNYPEEVLDEIWEDDGTMPDSLNALREAVVGHRIVSVEGGVETAEPFWGQNTATVITLDNGKRVELVNIEDCCAYTELRDFLLNVDLVDHVITGIGTTDGYRTWHVYADMGDVLELTVDWSSGNPFYYAYGFDIRVKESA